MQNSPCDTKSLKQLSNVLLKMIRPCVPSQVAYRYMRGEQSPGIKLSGQDTSIKAVKSLQVSSNVQLGIGSDGMVNTGELLIKHRN